MKVVCEMRNNHSTVFYTVQDEAGNRVNIRPDQLKDFCILRTFDNASYQDGKLIPTGDGFEIRTDVPPVDQRKHDLRSFVEMLLHTSIRVSAAKRCDNVRCDPNEFQIEAGGFVGRICIMPGTEWFNRNIMDRLHFTNAYIDSSQAIDPSRGFLFKYAGWKMRSCNMVNRLNEDYYFRIDSSPYYMMSWMENRGYKQTDIDYLVYVKGNINGCAVIGKDNMILDAVVFKTSV